MTLEPVDSRTPDKIYDQTLGGGIARGGGGTVGEEFRAAGKSRQFEILKPFLSSEGGEAAYARAPRT